MLHFADGLCWVNWDCLLLHESFHCIFEYIYEWKAVGHFRKCCKFQDSKPVSGTDSLDYSTPLLSSCIWGYLLASFLCVTSKGLPVKKLGPNGHCNCPGPRDSEEVLFFEHFLIAPPAIYFFTNASGCLTLPHPRLTTLDILSIAQKHINRRETFFIRHSLEAFKISTATILFLLLLNGHLCQIFYLYEK